MFTQETRKIAEARQLDHNCQEMILAQERKNRRRTQGNTVVWESAAEHSLMGA